MGTVFLDRDGTINVDTGYVSDASTLELIEGAARAIGDLKRAGWEIVIVSNQSGIGRGLIKPEQLTEVNSKLDQLLLESDADAVIDFSYFCPHTPKEQCACRKPLAGMLEPYLARGDFSAENSWIVGDKLSDIGLGASLGIPGKQQILVKTGKGAGEIAGISSLAYEPVVVDSLLEAGELILSSII